MQIGFEDFKKNHFNVCKIFVGGKTFSLFVAIKFISIAWQLSASPGQILHCIYTQGGTGNARLIVLQNS